MPLNQIVGHALTGIGLAMDCTAIAVAYGLSRPAPAESAQFKLAFAFGGFQALLFLLGWILGQGFRSLVGGWDVWIAFILLAGIGIKMIRESFGTGGSTEQVRNWTMGWRMLSILALAASIDAFAVGMGFSLTGTGVWLPSLLIGLFSIALPLLGFYGAARFGGGLGAWGERVGGFVLIGIGLKILAGKYLRGD